MKLALVLDNARFHKSQDVLALAADPAVDITLVFNLVARPDLATVGIERIWSRAKRVYRANVERLQALNHPYDHLGVVQQVLEDIPEQFAME